MTTRQRTTCLIIGGGPAGMIAGLLLARSGVPVTVLEKHGDFLRDFRGDTVHPTTLELLDELGLFDAFDELPHSRIQEVNLPLAGGGTVRVGDLRRIRLKHPYIAMIPQWDFLNLVAAAGEREPNFTLRLRTEVTGLVFEGDQVVGARFQDDDGAGEVRAHLTLAADGRWSTAAHQASLPVRDFPVDADVWWFRLPTAEGGDRLIAESLLPRGIAGQLYVGIPRRGYLQVARIIPKGADGRLRAEGIDALRRDVAAAYPELPDAAAALDFGDVKLLDVRLTRLERWHAKGLLCIGDAAHAMSPIAGVGINLAIQDGVAAARMLARPLLAGTIGNRDVAAVQRRRTPPTVATQTMQRLLHRGLSRIMRDGVEFAAPKALARLVERFPALTAVPAYAAAVGLRPEHAPAAARRPPYRPEPGAHV
ncbi:FAD-dependent oxidoreductase [Zhihengliuella salsuginis]|uniref:Oxidoreductase n=1 Tax=Zhihengliuella salsuginis TaxID=578222 RepID=A0ABQ3GGC8_9MICC|nr:FAD-dependent oxidoreductase [Zhihengliuella salsuginis]GHD04762.1 oxidoreductase [Zhihengliuella salsuginis]